PAANQVHTALSRPIRMSLGRSSWLLRPGQLSTLLLLPHGGSTALAIGGRTADGYFKRLSHGIGRPPRNAGFSVSANSHVAVVPARPGRVIDVAATRRDILVAALSPTQRSARVVGATQAARPPTAEAR